MHRLLFSVLLGLFSLSASAQVCRDEILAKEGGHESSAGRPAPGAYRYLHVEFSSMGTGIDQKSLDALLTLISSDLKASKLENVSTLTCGKEGERVFCLRFVNSLSAGEAEKRFENAILESRDVTKPAPSVSTAFLCNLD